MHYGTTMDVASLTHQFELAGVFWVIFTITSIYELDDIDLKISVHLSSIEICTIVPLCYI